ncbi:DEKNAAC105122 [Brettanomyces naardenensis]|uniref:DEKNAAC105124 n=1 Tax=Brettanomyces naardenensis TaxID=13370 RepID=A0A448YT32_BRENA|nr:DEKNAAC105122 [Brettanomyces naardenensis]
MTNRTNGINESTRQDVQRRIWLSNYVITISRTGANALTR